MNQDTDPLAKIVGAELRKLSPLKAPASLAENVLGRVRAMPEPAWWQQSIWSWPPLARGVFLIVAFSLLLLVSGGTWVASPELEGSWQTTASKLGGFSTLWAAVLSVLNWLLVLWDRAVQPLLPYLLTVVAVAYLLCLALGTAVVRLAYRHS